MAFCEGASRGVAVRLQPPPPTPPVPWTLFIFPPDFPLQLPTLSQLYASYSRFRGRKLKTKEGARRKRVLVIYGQGGGAGRAERGGVAPMLAAGATGTGIEPIAPWCCGTHIRPGFCTGRACTPQAVAAPPRPGARTASDGDGSCGQPAPATRALPTRSAPNPLALFAVLRQKKIFF